MDQQSNAGDGVSKCANVFDSGRGVGLSGLLNTNAISPIEHNSRYGMNPDVEAGHCFVTIVKTNFKRIMKGFSKSM